VLPLLGGVVAVIVGMLFMADHAREQADRARQTQVVMEHLRADSQLLDTVTWSSLALQRSTASTQSVANGIAAYRSLGLSLRALRRLGISRARLAQIEEPLGRAYGLGNQAIMISYRDPAAARRIATRSFSPALDRLAATIDAAALEQGRGARAAQVRARIGWLSSLGIGLLLLMLLGWRVHRIQRAAAVAEEARAHERRGLEAQRERQQLEGELQRARRLESVGQLAGGVAHDFNNLLAVIVNCAALAHDELPRGHAAQTELASIEDAAERGARLIRQLLLFSQSKAGAPELLDVNAVVRGMDGLLGHTLGRHIALRYELDPQPALVVADLSSFEQVLVNLVVNARDAVAAGGTITVRTANATVQRNESVELEVPSGSYMRMSVTDDGCGMDADTLTHACEPFFTTKGPGRGTGLGLATVFGVARQAGGCITLESRPGAGTTVHVLLPAATTLQAHPELAAAH
jgi:signal transduction histidine kinase